MREFSRTPEDKRCLAWECQGGYLPCRWPPEILGVRICNQPPLVLKSSLWHQAPGGSHLNPHLCWTEITLPLIYLLYKLAYLLITRKGFCGKGCPWPASPIASRPTFGHTSSASRLHKTFHLRLYTWAWRTAGPERLLKTYSVLQIFMKFNGPFASQSFSVKGPMPGTSRLLISSKW